MDFRQINLVQDSFIHVLPIPDAVAAAFYARLFQLAPDTRPLFRGDMVEQGRKLVLTLASVVDSLDRLDELLPVARELAIRHVGYGVLDRHYAVVGAALLDTLAVQLGDLFDTATHDAWAAAYTILADAMIEAGHAAARKSA